MVLRTRRENEKTNLASDLGDPDLSTGDSTELIRILDEIVGVHSIIMECQDIGLIQ